MTKRFSGIVLLAIFLISVAASAAVYDKDAGVTHYKPNAQKMMLFDDGSVTDEPSPLLGGGKFDPPFTYTPVGYWRQVYGDEITQQDRQHYTSPGRQIVYAGYFNAACDYVYMDWAYRGQIGSTVLQFCHFAIFDWLVGDWDLSAGGFAVQVGPPGRALSPNIGVATENGSPVVTYYDRTDQQPWYSMVNYGGVVCPSYTFVNDTVPGPPNVQGVSTGYCDDNTGSSISSPYMWPIIDLDTNDAGLEITHISYQEWGFCPDVPTDDIDANSLLYARKVSTVDDEPWTGTWEGPYLMDSVYDIAHLVRADKSPGSNDVYFAYIKPVYYQTGTPSYCAGNGHYQLTGEVVYRKSNDDGATWGPITYVTDYQFGFEDGLTDPAFYELTGMVDPNGTFHLVWLSANRSPDNPCSVPFACRLYHWDNTNNCISVVFDASHPALMPSGADVGAWNWLVAKPNISYCDGNYYVAFTRFGAHTDPENDDLVWDIAHHNFVNGDIYVVCSDAVSGSSGQVWSNAVNLTNTETDSCLPGECQSEHWPTMAMYSDDSLLIEYILDLEPGAKGGVNENDVCEWTDNPVIFMTWPCFAMSDLPQNLCVATSPSTPVYPEIALAPFGDGTGCTTEGTFTADLTMSNCGNVNLSYTATPNEGWLSLTAGSSGNISAGTGPRGSDNALWSGAPGCATPATISWQANSASLDVGNYTGTITVDISDPGAEDFEIEVNLVVACDYYLPEFATITGGCWIIDVFNTPTDANGIENDQEGNMTFYACGDTIAPLYHESFLVGWDNGGVVMYGDGITSDSSQYHMRALSGVTVTPVGNPGSGSGYWASDGYWCTPDSVVHGRTQFFVPGHQDTAVLIKKVTIWNESGTTLNNFIAAEDVDWDADRDSAWDVGGIDFARNMVYQRGHDANDDSVVCGVSAYGGYDANLGARVINGYDYTYFSLGFYPDTAYDLLTSLDGNYTVFSDSSSGTEMHSVFRFREGSMSASDTFDICYIKAVSLDGVTGLQELIDKGIAFIEDYDLCEVYTPPQCQGECGDANNDGGVNVSDAVWIINFVFVAGSQPPQPVLACGDANGDAGVNVSDAVWVINFVFVSGSQPPGDCSPGSWGGDDCCEFTP